MLRLCTLLSLCMAVSFANICEDPNSEPKSCIDYCAPSCAFPQGPESCIEPCTPGCDCVEGFVRDGDRCVTLSECKNDVCANDSNTEFSECGTCEATCQMPNGPEGCGDVCLVGCFCRDGYVRNADGICINLEECPSLKSCKEPNTVYTECGPACPKTCEKVIDYDCPDVCVPGCFCRIGFVSHNGICIDENECPASKK